MFAETATDLLNANWDKLSFLSACVIVIVILWRLVGKLAADKDGASAKMVEFYQKRAEEAVAMAKSYENVLAGNTQAMNALTKQTELTNELLRDLIRELEKRD